MNRQTAWLLGYLMADGSITQPAYRKKGDETHLQFICKYDDREILYKVKSILNTKGNIGHYPNYKSPNSKLRVYDRKDFIEKYKSIKSEVPNDIVGFEKDYIRGAIDGDGTLSYRKNRNSFRIGFLNQCKEITEWIAKTIIAILNLPEKTPRYKPQDNAYEIIWEGNIAKLIANWLYSDAPENCRLERKYNTYKQYVLNNIEGYNEDEKMLVSCGAYIDDNLEIAFNVPGLQTLDWCKRLMKQLSFKSTPVFHNKGKRKYYHLYIPDKNLAANMRDSLLGKQVEGIVH